MHMIFFVKYRIKLTLLLHFAPYNLFINQATVVPILRASGPHLPAIAKECGSKPHKSTKLDYQRFQI